MSQESDVDPEEDLILISAIQVLNAYPDPGHPAKDFDSDNLHLRPPTLLNALLQFAPSATGRKNIAVEIAMALNGAEETNSKLEELTSYYWHTLLIPCASYHF